MSLSNFQKDVDQWTAQFEPQYWPPHQILARLIEEVGELAREVNHLYGFKKKKITEAKNNLGQEMSDVIFTIACLANSEKIDLEKEWQEMVEEKLYKRDKDRYEKIRK